MWERDTAAAVRSVFAALPGPAGGALWRGRGGPERHAALRQRLVREPRPAQLQLRLGGAGLQRRAGQPAVQLQDRGSLGAAPCRPGGARRADGVGARRLGPERAAERQRGAGPAVGRLRPRPPPRPAAHAVRPAQAPPALRLPGRRPLRAEPEHRHEAFLLLLLRLLLLALPGVLPGRGSAKRTLLTEGLQCQQPSGFHPHPALPPPAPGPAHPNPTAPRASPGLPPNLHLLDRTGLDRDMPNRTEPDRIAASFNHT